MLCFHNSFSINMQVSVRCIGVKTIKDGEQKWTKKQVQIVTKIHAAKTLVRNLLTIK